MKLSLLIQELTEIAGKEGGELEVAIPFGTDTAELDPLLSIDVVPAVWDGETWLMEQPLKAELLKKEDLRGMEKVVKIW